MEIRVKFKRKLFGSEDGDFSVFSAEPVAKDRNKVSVSKEYGTFTISGNYYIQNNELDKEFTVTIFEDDKSRYPNSYELVRLHYDLPETAKEQWSHLRTMITRNQYDSFCDTFDYNDKIIDIILNNVKLIEKVGGYGESTAIKLKERLEKDQGKAILFNKFGYISGVGPGVINKLYNKNPDVSMTVAQIEKNPYSLLSIDGIGFVVADNIALELGVEFDSKERCLHGVSYFLDEYFQQMGHTYTSVIEAIKFTADKLRVGQVTLQNHLLAVKDDVNEMKYYRIMIFSNHITTYKLFEAEQLIFKSIRAMRSDKISIDSKENWANKVKLMAHSSENSLTDEQEEFLNAINEERITLLVGPGGVGKSWVTKIAYDLFKDAGLNVGLYAPTARAAHVMGEYVGETAMTIHRGMMLAYKTKDYLNDDVVILDEASMIDSELMSMVFSVLKSNARLIIIGDDFQLPSVSPGNILYNLINDIKVPMTRLTKVFRQEEGSYILEMSNEIRQRKFNLTPGVQYDYKDISLIHKTDVKDIADVALNLYKKSHKSNGVEEVMLLTPVNQNAIGRHTLNKEVQKLVNKGNNDAMVFGKNLNDENMKTYFKQGDFITIKKNDYAKETQYGDTKEIINGDLGEIVISTDKFLIVEINGETYRFTKEEVSDYIEHAWAITIHKSQGGQANEVIILIPPYSSKYVSANMLYTAITRTKKHCTVIGDFNELNKAAKQFVNFNRRTMLGLYKA